MKAAASCAAKTHIRPSLVHKNNRKKNFTAPLKAMAGSSSYLAPDTYHSMNPSDDELIFLHTMIRSSNLEKTMAFFQALGLQETRRKDSEKGKFTLVFMASSPGAPEIEITHNWGPEELFGALFFHFCYHLLTLYISFYSQKRAAPPSRSMGHLAFATADIYKLCSDLQEKGIVILRPPRDGRMAFVKSPDGISVELLQKGEALGPSEPWASMENTGSW